MDKNLLSINHVSKIRGGGTVGSQQMKWNSSPSDDTCLFRMYIKQLRLIAAEEVAEGLCKKNSQQFWFRNNSTGVIKRES